LYSQYDLHVHNGKLTTSSAKIYSEDRNHIDTWKGDGGQLGNLLREDGEEEEVGHKRKSSNNRRSRVTQEGLLIEGETYA
jgi:hypothetical protein